MVFSKAMTKIPNHSFPLAVLRYSDGVLPGQGSPDQTDKEEEEDEEEESDAEESKENKAEK